jgi:urea carboxylase
MSVDGHDVNEQFSTILHVLGATAADRPAIRYRQSGDRQILIEYGDMEVDLRLNFLVHAFIREIESDPIDGVVEAVPGFRSVMVTFDPAIVDRDRLLDELSVRQLRSSDLSSVVLPSRVLTLPIAFDDEMTRKAVHRYRITTRADAPNVVDGDNIDYIVRCNGLSGREEFYERFLAATWWNAFIGYFPGLPSLFSLDPLTQLTVPKYNPARMWTAEGAVGLGGPCVVLYPMEAPGGYQLFGRTLPLRHLDRLVSSRAGRAPSVGSAEQIRTSHLFQVCDRVRFTRVSEVELLARRVEVLEQTYEYDIVDGEFALAEYLDDVARLAPEAARVADHRRRAAARVEIP